MTTLKKLFLPLLMVPTFLSAGTLLNQPFATIDGRTSHTTNGTNGLQVWERFSLPQSAYIDKITFVGAFVDLGTTANNPVQPAGNTWNFQLATDNAGDPGALTSSQSLAFNAVQQTLLGSASLAGQPVFFYSFTANLLTPIFVNGGETSWLSVLVQSDNADPRFAWISGSGGDGVSKQISLGSGNISTYTDRALTLDGSNVPEPGTFVLLSAGALLIGLFRRR